MTWCASQSAVTGIQSGVGHLTQIERYIPSIEGEPW